MPSDSYLMGESLIGDDYGPEEITRWFEDEANAYAELHFDVDSYIYEYSALNQYYFFRHVPPDRRFSHVVGFGSAAGHELLPIDRQTDRFSIIESADVYHEHCVLHSDVSYLPADPSGDIDVPDRDADLITCFGAIHHIPTVTHTLSEMYRVLRPGGVLFLREPVISLGDWSEPRPGLTPRERGIPRKYLERALKANGFDIMRASWCDFPGSQRLGRVVSDGIYNNTLVVMLDSLISSLLAVNYRYHATSLLDRFRPTSVAVLAKRLASS